MAVAKAPPPPPHAASPANVTQQQQQQALGPPASAVVGSSTAAAAAKAGQGPGVGPGFVLLQLLDVLLPELAKMGKELEPHNTGEACEHIRT
jgi:hypothetical protein